MCRLMICGSVEERGWKPESRRRVFFAFFILILLFTSCNYTKHLAKEEYALTRNTIKVEGAKGTQFDDLISLVRPIPNKKFMEIFPIKVSLWAKHQPKYDSITGKTKDSKFNQWCRRNGEPPVLLDTADIQHSIAQIGVAMAQRGYFNSQINVDVKYLKKNKVKVNYVVTPKQPFYIRSINYQIEIPEYRRTILIDTANSLIKKGTIYNESLLIAERARLISLIKDKGYFYASPSVITFLIDTNNTDAFRNAQRNPTLAITVRVSFDKVEDASLIAKHKNRYKFNNVLIYTNYDLNFEKNIFLDTIAFRDFRHKTDSTLYKFVTIKKIKRKTNKLKVIKDYNSRTIAGAIWMKKGSIYSQTALDRTYKKFRDLSNFTIINITYQEDEKLWDSITKSGVLNTTVRLTRAKQNDINASFNLQTDRTGLALSYLNKNIFKGAEALKISAFGSIYYYKWLNSLIKKEVANNDNLIYGEVGGEVSFRFPRLLMLTKYQDINFWDYSTEIKFAASYSQLFTRLNLQLAYIYRWSPSRSISHSVSPVELATLDSRSNRNLSVINKYPASYQRKFDKFFLPSAKYTFSFIPSLKNTSHILNLNFSFETVGLLLYSINTVANKNATWKIMNNFNYGTFEKLDLNLTYVKIINKNNAFATRFVFGMAIPFKKGSIIPFERSFFVGGANSMRGWTFRQLGPGGYFSDPEQLIERVGDMKIEFNLEHRGTIYKAIKYGLFTDIGNVWLLSKYKQMPDAEFRFSNFYKQIAFCAGAGLRLDFKFFIIRFDYGLPIYDPSKPIGKYWINKEWFNKKNKLWSATQGIQFGIGYAF